MKNSKDLREAQEAGYTDSKGHARSMAKPDVEGHPTGAFTDIGHGRSSVVKTKSEMEKKKTVERAPKMGDEKAP